MSFHLLLLELYCFTAKEETILVSFLLLFVQFVMVLEFKCEEACVRHLQSCAPALKCFRGAGFAQLVNCQCGTEVIDDFAQGEVRR